MVIHIPTTEEFKDAHITTNNIHPWEYGVDNLPTHVKAILDMLGKRPNSNINVCTAYFLLLLYISLSPCPNQAIGGPFYCERTPVCFFLKVMAYIQGAKDQD
jgi:hypothetical protein